MSTSERRRKVLTYKHAAFTPGRGNLQQLLTGALNTLQKNGARRQSSGDAEASQQFIVIGEYAIETEFVFGVLMRYSPGTAAVTVVDDTDATLLKVETFIAPQHRGKRREWIDGLLFFAVRRNHVVLLQSASMRAHSLEAHLRWLLRKAKLLPESKQVTLDDTPTRAAEELLSKAKVKNVSFGGDFSPPLEQGGATDVSPSESREAVRKVHDSLAGSGPMSEALLEFLSKLAKFDQRVSLNLDELAGANLSFKILFQYDRKTTESGQTFLRKLGRSLRNAEGLDTTLLLDGGGKVTNDMLRVSGQMPIEFIDGVPNSSSAFEAMRSFLLSKIQSGEITE